MTTWKYWRYIFGLAFRKYGSDLKKGVGRFIATVVGVAAAVYYVPTLFDYHHSLNWLIPPFAVLASLLGGLAWNVIAIPATLHKQQLTRDEYSRIARDLEVQHGRGEALLLEFDDLPIVNHDNDDLPSGVVIFAPRICPHEFERGGLQARISEWFFETDRQVRAHDESEAYMFRTITPSETVRQDEHVPTPEEMQKHLQMQLGKLRLIVGRAYERTRPDISAAIQK